MEKYLKSQAESTHHLEKVMHLDLREMLRNQEGILHRDLIHRLRHMAIDHQVTGYHMTDRITIDRKVIRTETAHRINVRHREEVIDRLPMVDHAAVIDHLLRADHEEQSDRMQTLDHAEAAQIVNVWVKNQETAPNIENVQGMHTHLLRQRGLLMLSRCHR